MNKNNDRIRNIVAFVNSYLASKAGRSALKNGTAIALAFQKSVQV